MTQTADEFGDELADFVRRVGELRTARSQSDGEQRVVLDAALFELQHVVDQLWPRYEQFVADATGAPGSPGDRQERLLLKALFQRLPLPVALVDRETVVRRLNFAATGLTGARAGYATGRPLAALLMPGDRAAFRSQAAAVARGEGDRGLTVRLQQRPEEPLLATLTALRPPDEPHPAVLVVFQPGISRAASAAAPPPEVPDLAESTRHARLMDLVDTMAAALLRLPPGDRTEVLATAARVLCGASRSGWWPTRWRAGCGASPCSARRPRRTPRCAARWPGRIRPAPRWSRRRPGPGRRRSRCSRRTPTVSATTPRARRSWPVRT